MSEFLDFVPAFFWTGSEMVVRHMSTPGCYLKVWLSEDAEAPYTTSDTYEWTGGTASGKYCITDPSKAIDDPDNMHESSAVGEYVTIGKWSLWPDYEPSWSDDAYWMLPDRP